MMQARENMKKRFSRSSTQKSPRTNSELLTGDDAEEENKGGESPAGTPRRNWVTINNKVDAKALKNVNEDESASQINLEAEMEKYLGGDEEVLKGFYDSDEEVVFDSINPDTQANASNQSFFGRITSAFQSIAGNKVLTREDMEPILANFAQTLMDKNVN